MATNKEIKINGVMTPVTDFSHTSQEIDDATERALEGGAIDQLLAGKAPDGYGIGSVGRTVTDLDDALVSGFYSAIGAANIPSNIVSAQYAQVLVLSLNTGRVTQVYFHNVTGGTGAIAVRRLDGNGWSPWEFINPPMVIDVEYRTTERYQGKPVYVKLVNFGALPNATLKGLDHGIQDMSVPFSIEGHITNGLRTAVSSSDISWSCTSSKLMAITTTDMSTRNAYVKIKYTKTTD